MRQLRLKFAGKEDVETIKAWITQNSKNGFDKDVLGYPTLQLLCSYDESGPVSFMPTQKSVVLESVATKPGLDGVTAAQALRDMVKGAMLEASSHGIKEIYFIGTDPAVVEIAKNHEFEVLPWPVLRLKL